jgi:hypothetical protein
VKPNLVIDSALLLTTENREKDGHTKVESLFATEAGRKSGERAGFKMESADKRMVFGELEMDKRSSWESNVENVGKKVAARAKAPAC